MKVGGAGGGKKIDTKYIKTWIEAIRDAAIKKPGSFFVVEIDYRPFGPDSGVSYSGEEVDYFLGYGKYGNVVTGDKWSTSRSKIVRTLLDDLDAGYEEWSGPPA